MRLYTIIGKRRIWIRGRTRPELEAAARRALPRIKRAIEYVGGHGYRVRFFATGRAGQGCGQYFDACHAPELGWQDARVTGKAYDWPHLVAGWVPRFYSDRVEPLDFVWNDRDSPYWHSFERDHYGPRFADFRKRLRFGNPAPLGSL